MTIPKPTRTKTGKRNRYPDDFRAAVILMLEAAGWPDKKGALTAVAKKNNVPLKTLSRWAHAEQNPPPVETVNVKRIDFQEAVEQELAAIFEEMNNARQDATYQQLGTVSGILFDKRQILLGGATENIDQRIRIEYNDD